MNSGARWGNEADQLDTVDRSHRPVSNNDIDRVIIQEIERILTSSPQRAEPPCPHFSDCGGCALQHLQPEAYQEFKRGTLAVISGKLSKQSPKAVKFSTPSTVLGVRGTEFVIEVGDGEAQ